MMLPRWNEVVPAMSMGMVTRRAEPATVRAAISATKTIFRVEIFCFFSILVSPLFFGALNPLLPMKPWAFSKLPLNLRPFYQILA